MKNVCEVLGITRPVVQAPMTWITSAELAAAVSNAGGLGILGTNAGQQEASPDPEVVYRKMCEEIRKTKTLTDKPFGINYMLPVPGMEDDPSANMFSEATLRAAVDAGCPVVVAVGAYSGKELQKIKALGKTLIFREETPTVENAVKAQADGADVIVATGYDEGGGVPGREIGTIAIVPIISEAVDVPVLAAGGIVDSRGFNAALALGAQGVYCGTAFITSEESFAHPDAKMDIVNHSSFDLIMYRALPFVWRATPHELSRMLKEKSDEGLSLMEMYKLMGGTTSLHIAQKNGDLEHGINSVSTAISLIKEVRTCKAIIDEMTKDY